MAREQLCFGLYRLGYLDQEVSEAVMSRLWVPFTPPGPVLGSGGK